MNIAFLILAHNTPNHLGRLIRRIASPQSKVYIHVDRKTPIEPYKYLVGENIVLLQNRVDVYWGDFSQVDAILILVQAALNSGYEFDRAVLLSGSDYPICALGDINRFFESNSSFEYLSAVRMPNAEYSKPISRLTNYRHAEGDPWVKKIWVELLCRVGLMKNKRDYRTGLGDLDPYAGPTWWALSRSSCEYVMIFIASNPDLVKFYRNSYFPDESLFHTIIANSRFGIKLKSEVTYADWSKGGVSPATLSLEDVETVMNLRWQGGFAKEGAAGFLFARKFPDDSAQIVDAIDHFLIGSA